MKGLDISSYQNGINFNSIKSSGVDFLILRAGFTGWGTGVNYNKDSCFVTEYSIRQTSLEQIFNMFEDKHRIKNKDDVEEKKEEIIIGIVVLIIMKKV